MKAEKNIRNNKILQMKSKTTDLKYKDLKKTVNHTFNIKKQNFDGLIEQLFKFFRKQQYQSKAGRQINQIDDEDIMKFEISHLLKIDPTKRTSIDIKNIKKQLKEQQYFAKSIFDGQSQTSQRLKELLKRQNHIVLQLIAPFLTIRQYSKGSLIQVTGMERQAIHFLLHGQVSIFQPINHTMLRNCLKKVEQGDYQPNQISLRFKDVAQDEKNFLMTTQQDRQSQISNKSFCTAHSSYNSRAKPQEISKYDNQFSSADCQNILSKRMIDTKETKHKLTKSLKKSDLISAQSSSTFLKQKHIYEVSAICATSCYIMKIDYNIAKKICFIVNSDQQKIYTQALLLKFPQLLYKHTQKFVNHQYIIDKSQNKYFLSDLIKNSKLISSQKFLNDEQNYKQSHKKQQEEQQIIQASKQQIKYNGNAYFLMKGQVTIIINKKSQRKHSDLNLKAFRQSYVKKQLLKINGPNLFGLQSIGQDQNYKLSYIITPYCKILQLKKEALLQTYEQLPQFRQHIKKIVERRNLILSNIMKRNICSQKRIRLYRRNHSFCDFRNDQENKRHGSANFQRNTSSSVNQRYKKISICSQNQQKFCKRSDQNLIKKNVYNNIKQMLNDKTNQVMFDNLQIEGNKTQIRRQNIFGLGSNLTNNIEVKNNKQKLLQQAGLSIRNKNNRFQRKRKFSQFNVSFDQLQLNQTSISIKINNNDTQNKLLQMSHQGYERSYKKSSKIKNQPDFLKIIRNEKIQKYLSSKLIDSQLEERKQKEKLKQLNKEKIKSKNSLKSGRRFISGRC